MNKDSCTKLFSRSFQSGNIMHQANVLCRYKLFGNCVTIMHQQNEYMYRDVNKIKKHVDQL